MTTAHTAPVAVEPHPTVEAGPNMSKAIDDRAMTLVVDDQAREHVAAAKTADQFQTLLAHRSEPVFRRTTDLLVPDPVDDESLIEDPVTKVVMCRPGQNVTLTGPAKGGKSQAVGSLARGLLVPSGSLLGYYAITRAFEPNEFMVIIECEQQPADQRAQLAPYLADLPARDKDRILTLNYAGMGLDLSNDTVAELVAEEALGAMHEVATLHGIENPSINLVVIDPLFRAVAGNEWVNDPSLPSKYHDAVLHRFCRVGLGAKTTLTVAHTSAAGGRGGGTGDAFGSSGWRGIFDVTWALKVTRESSGAERRTFGPNGKGRRATGDDSGMAYLTVLDELTGRVIVDPSTVGEATALHHTGERPTREFSTPSTATVLREILTRVADGRIVMGSRQVSDNFLASQVPVVAKELGIDNAHTSKAKVAEVLKEFSEFKNVTTTTGERKSNNWTLVKADK